MSEVVINKWERKVKQMSREQVIRFQLLVHCHLGGIRITETDLESLTFVGMEGECDLRVLCEQLADRKLYSSSQSARNSLGLLQDKGLICKEGKNRKKVRLAPQMKLQTQGNILLDIKCLSREYDTVQG